MSTAESYARMKGETGVEHGDRSRASKKRGEGGRLNLPLGLIVFVVEEDETVNCT